jgi:hypothetical protein
MTTLAKGQSKYLVKYSLVVVLVLLDQRWAARIDEPVAALPSGTAEGGGHDGVELVAAPQPELDGVAGLQLVAVDVESGANVAISF